MKEKEKETLVPILWDWWDQVEINFMQFYNVEFYENFGPFLKGESFSSVSVDYMRGIIEGYSEDGNEVVKSCKFTAIPLEQKD